MPKAQRECRHLSDMFAEVALATGIGYVAAAYAASRWLTRTTRGSPVRNPAHLGLSFEPADCTTRDGQHLKGWIVTPSQARGTVVLFHGVHNHREQTLERIEFLAAAGYRCVAFDHRAHGESTGRRTSFGYFESLDVAAVLDLVEERWPRQPRAALGISMGAAALCYTPERSRTCNAVILEGLYHDIGTAFASRMHTYPPWFGGLARAILWVSEKRLRLRMGQLAPFEYIDKLAPTPVLLITGSDDSHASPADVQRLFERCREPREMWIVPRAGHKDVCETGGAAYRQRVLDFLERRLAA